MALKKNLLIIKHGALGDFILSFGPFKAIRDHHLNDRLFLLTTNKFKNFAEESNYFDEIIIDDRPNFWNIKTLPFSVSMEHETWISVLGFNS